MCVTCTERLSSQALVPLGAWAVPAAALPWRGRRRLHARSLARPHPARVKVTSSLSEAAAAAAAAAPSTERSATAGSGPPSLPSPRTGLPEVGRSLAPSAAALGAPGDARRETDGGEANATRHPFFPGTGCSRASPGVSRQARAAPPRRLRSFFPPGFWSFGGGAGQARVHAGKSRRSPRSLFF